MEAPTIASRSQTSPTTRSRLDALGQRLRAARKALGLSQEKLAQPEFTKSYVSAVERGKVRPSLKALELLSQRLGIPISDLLAAVPPAANEPSVPALEQDLNFEMARARMLINRNQAAEAVRVLNAAEDTYRLYPDEMAASAQFNIVQLRAAAHLRLNEPTEARAELSRAMDLAEQMPDGVEEVERVRNQLGLVYYEQDMPHLALDQHLHTVAAVRSGIVKDIHLRLAIYSSLANDYWALGDAKQAVEVYKEALAELGDANNLNRQADQYWQLGAARQAAGDREPAAQYAARALGILEAAENLAALAQMHINLAAVSTADPQIGDAEQQLGAARAILLGLDDPVRLSALNEHYTTLALANGQPDAGAEYARQSLALVEQAVANQAEGADPLAQAHLRRTRARALRAAGMSAHAQGDYARSDVHFEQALSLREDGEYDETITQIQLDYANLLADRGDHAKASGLYQSAFNSRNRRAAR